MMVSSTRAIRRGILCGAASIALVPAFAAAQVADPLRDPNMPSEAAGSLGTGQSVADQDGAAVPADDIIVTGTILRGAPPVGSNLISVGEARIQSSGATTPNELLATVPQVSNLFNNVPTARLGVAVNNIQVVRPNLRNLASETSSSSSTLVLFDGHRIASVGVTQNAIDPDIIPSLAVERVEVVTDGGSATYGSDAVGGVINFITRKRYDGVKVQASYGFADDYYQVQAGAIVGKDWGSGSIFAAYSYQHNDEIFGRDRDFIRDVDFLSPNLTARGRSCAPGNVQVTRGSGASAVTNQYALPTLTSAVPNVCDPTDDSTVVPASTRHGAIVGLHQELADWLTADLRGFYGERKAVGLAPFRGSVSLRGASSGANFRSFYYTPVPAESATATQTVFFSLAPVLGQNTLESLSEFQEWGANAEFKINLGANWQLRPLFNYSRSSSLFRIQQLNPALLSAFASGANSVTAAGAINYYNPGAGANDLANIQQLVNSELAGQGKSELFDARVILDGTLFTLPGGEVKVAVGYEYMRDRFQVRNAPANGVIGAVFNQPYSSYARGINSVFGEVQVPIVGDDNRMGFIHTLTLAGSVRYDHFSDFGGTTNPKVGVNFKPLAWLGFRGNYSTSFNAPSPNDQLGSLNNTIQIVPGINAFVKPGDSPTAFGTVALRGSTPGLIPQTAKSWSVGADLDPPFLEGLHASVNYYNVKFKNIISIPTPNSGIFANFPNNVISNPAGLPLATIADFLNNSGSSQAPTALATITAGCTNAAACSNVYELVNFRQGNYGNINVQGLDFAVNYRATTGFGGIDAGVSGNYVLSRKSQTGVGAPVIDELRTNNFVLANGLRIVTNAASRLQLQATLGADVGNFRAQATLNHTSGFGVVRCDPTTTPVCRPSATGVATSGGLPQDRVGAFDTVNLFFKYAVPSDSLLLKDLELTLNINNVFDTDPPLFAQNGSSTPGYSNGFTLGRLVQIGIAKKF
jgi:iron complex outermembrane recepter protein